MKKKIVRVYTDGSCITGTNVGGYCAIIISDEGRHIIRGGEVNTTNNRMELMAVIKSLEYLYRYHRNDSIQIYSDSKYVVSGITEWLKKWIMNNWKTSNGSRVSNVDLWLKIKTFVDQMNVEFHWVRGHNGNVENENCDKIAKEEARKLLKNSNSEQ